MKREMWVQSADFVYFCTMLERGGYLCVAGRGNTWEYYHAQHGTVILCLEGE